MGKVSYNHLPDYVFALCGAVGIRYNARHQRGG
jgi:hypothetical protein